MARAYKPHIPQNVGEVMDQLDFMMIASPKFIDGTGYFPQQNIETVFFQLNEGLRMIQGKLGMDLYLKLVDMSHRMRAHFEADPEDETGDTRKGCAIIREMDELLKEKVRKS